jgi:hypothetical protein
MTAPILNTLDRAEAALFALRSSTRRSQVKAVLTSLKTSLALEHPAVAAAIYPEGCMELSPSAAQAAWAKAIDLILEEKV